MQARFAGGRLVFLQLCVEGAVPLPKIWIHEDEVEDARGFGKFRERLAVAGRERCLIGVQGHGRETRDHLLKLSEVGHSVGKQ